jgi:CRISPR-associated RAMP protein, Cmr1 family
MNEKIDLNNLMADVDGFIKKRLVAKIEFKGVTPWWGGDHDGYTSNHIDEDEIVGRVKWFLRTVCNRYCVNDLNSYKEAEDKVSSYLGCTNNKSIYSFKVSNTIMRENTSYSHINRVSFLLRDKEPNVKEKFIPKDVTSFTLEIFRDRHHNKFDEIIVGAVLITLAFLGIGKGANRGFGRFIPINLDGLNTSIYSKIIQGDIRGAFKEFYDKFKRVENCTKQNSWTDSCVPLAPLINGDNADSILETSCTSNNIVQILEIIQESVLKATFKRLSYNMNVKEAGPFIHTWIYGLPRHSKVPQNIRIKQNNMEVKCDDVEVDINDVEKNDEMGYFKLASNRKLEEPRRQSMFVISPVLMNNGVYKIFIIPFLSLKDNEEAASLLIHKGIHINNNTIHIVGIEAMIKNNISKQLFNNELNLANKRRDLSFGDLDNLIKKYTQELFSIINKQCKQKTTNITTTHHSYSTNRRPITPSQQRPSVHKTRGFNRNSKVTL